MNARPTNHGNTTKAYAYRRQRRPAALAGTKRQGMQNSSESAAKFLQDGRRGHEAQ
jgi:hypothetical protein